MNKLEYTPAEDTFALLHSLPAKMSSALEVGCGSCFILKHLDAKHRVGCDIRKPVNVGDGIDFGLCDGRRLPFRHGRCGAWGEWGNGNCAAFFNSVLNGYKRRRTDIHTAFIAF